MRLLSTILGSAALALAATISGCGMIAGHIDCDQVAQQQRAGSTDAEIAQQTGFTVADVQSCSQTASAAGRERESNYSEQPRLPVVPNITAGSVRPSGGVGAGGIR